jgi:hypothetical protein
MNHVETSTGSGSADADFSGAAGEKFGSFLHTLKVNLLLRRRYLVNPGRQIRSAVLVTFVAIVPLIILNISLHLGRVLEREALFSEAGPELLNHIAAFDRTEFILVLLASVVFAIGVFVMTILETHQTSGAAVGIVRHLELVRDGHYGNLLRLRDSDNLQELVTPFNEMSIALADRARATARALDVAADDADGLANGSNLASQLRELATYQSSLAGPPGRVN